MLKVLFSSVFLPTGINLSVKKKKKVCELKVKISNVKRM